MPDSYDVKKDLRHLYAPRRGVIEVVDVPALRFLAADGHGDPNTSTDYRAVVEALYTASYAVRAVAKAELGRVHTVGPLEGLWSADDVGVFHARDKAAWDWTMMIVQPEWVTPDVVDAALARVRATKDLPALSLLRFEEVTEGLSVQTLHVGSYDDEGPVIARMHDEFMPANRLVPRGRHHEVYLSDARRTEPARLRTILRQPVDRSTVQSVSTL
ncbi:GyrI-like domain-containing protein [Thalassiella azotivora]